MSGFTSKQISYNQTNAFSAIVKDYVSNVAALRPFYEHIPNGEGIGNAITLRKKFNTNRTVLVSQLKVQYSGLLQDEKVKQTIESLLQENTFTITTAHQPNIFTGHLYFVYKILHAIKLAEECKAKMPDCNFVPVYYMGSEDADLEELGEVTINGKKYIWETPQTGAVGRMKIDKAFIKMIDAIEGQLLVEPYGALIMAMVRESYSLNKTIEQATFELVHKLFGAYGLIVLLPDNAVLKREFIPVIKKELEEQFSNKAVMETMSRFPGDYKVQAAGREINLFYLKDDNRDRIVKEGSLFKVQQLTFSQTELLDELESFPDRFSPNVILRPVFQELILPNIAFIGGGGELAYWLELKKVFETANVPYPVLILRNSFMLVNKNASKMIASLQMNVEDFFKPANDLVQLLVKQSSNLQLDLIAEKKSLEILYAEIQKAAGAVDTTLQQHSKALFTQANKKIETLEKKMLKAEKKKFEAQQRHVEKIKTLLFPNGNLQERVDNLLAYYALYGEKFIEVLYKNSQGLKQEFCIVTETE